MGSNFEGRLNEVERAVVRMGEAIGRIDKRLESIEASVSTWKWQVLAAAVAVALASWAATYSVQQMTVQTFAAALTAAQAAAAAQAPASPASPTIIYVSPPAAATPAAAASSR